MLFRLRHSYSSFLSINCLYNCIQKKRILIDIFTNEVSPETLSFEDNKVSISELLISEELAVCNKKLKDIKLDKPFNISAIYRKPNLIIPKGETELVEGDKIFIMAASENKDYITSYFMRGRR